MRRVVFCCPLRFLGVLVRCVMMDAVYFLTYLRPPPNIRQPLVAPCFPRRNWYNPRSLPRSLLECRSFTYRRCCNPAHAPFLNNYRS
ncbi:hypothetical protein FPV67DRAFT_308892 [Lyophyllum atratum]|nr:hypothetical protein FPV67DRAFT_308892 [Lyophyllum atratum]